MDALSATGAALVLDDGRIAWPEGVAGAYAMRQPLRWRGRQIGELVADRATPFTDDDRELLASIATHAAVALEHADAVMRGVLAQEIHHRVKNNLQTVASLLRLQARSADETDPREALEHSVNRILAIAAVHELLTERRDEDVELADLIDRLRAMLVQGVGGGKEVTSSLEPVSLPGARATALALVFSELLQNALEHGGGRIKVELSARNGDVVLVIADDGDGVVGEEAGHRPLDRARARPRRAARHPRPALRRRHPGRGRVSRLAGRVVDAAPARRRAVDGRRRPGRQYLAAHEACALELLQRECECPRRDPAEGLSQLGEAAVVPELGEDRDRPLAQQDVMVAGGQHGGGDDCNASSLRGGQVLRPQRVAVARVAPHEALAAERVERTGERLAPDAQAPLQLDEARTAAVGEQRESRRGPAMVKERDQFGG